MFHAACLAWVVSWLPSVVTIFMAHANGDKQWPAKRRHMQGILDETDPLISCISVLLLRSTTFPKTRDRAQEYSLLLFSKPSTFVSSYTLSPSLLISHLSLSLFLSILLSSHSFLPSLPSVLSPLFLFFRFQF